MAILQKTEIPILKTILSIVATRAATTATCAGIAIEVLARKAIDGMVVFVLAIGIFCSIAAFDALIGLWSGAMATPFLSPESPYSRFCEQGLVEAVVYYFWILAVLSDQGLLAWVLLRDINVLRRFLDSLGSVLVCVAGMFAIHYAISRWQRTHDSDRMV